MSPAAEISFSNLDPSQRERLAQFTGPFDAALKAKVDPTTPVVLTDHLPPPGDELRAAGLYALAVIELEHRWSGGEQPQLEEYLLRYPKLGTTQTVAFELIREEYRIRHEHGDRPPLSHYQDRFPTQFDQLQQWARQQASADNSADNSATLQPPSAPPASTQPASTLHPPVHGLDDTVALPNEPTSEEPTSEDSHIDLRATPLPVDDPTATARDLAATIPLDDAPESDSPTATTPEQKTPERNRPTSAIDATVPDPAIEDTIDESESHKTLSVEGRYRLIKKIGSGNFGEVWLSEAPGGVQVAVKAIMRPIGSRLAQQELSALEVMKSLRHAFLVQVQAYWLDGDRLMIVMELADRNLLERLEECRSQGEVGIPLDELLDYFRESAEALDYLHSEKVLHRDIKPANIMLLRDHAKLADFGLARVLEDRRMQVTATSVGTPLYMAPEVWDKKIGPQSDQYSLAATYVELRLDRPVFVGDSMGEMINAHLRLTPELDPLPLPEQEVLIRALAKKPEDRYATCSEFIEALDAAARPKPTTIVEVPAKRARLVSIVILMIAVPLIAWLIYRGVGKPPALEIAVPSGCEAAAGAQLITIGDRRHYDRIDRLLPDGRRVAFLLIPSVRTADPKPFYIMENMVSNRVFGQFAKAQPKAVAKSEWKLGAIAKQQDVGVKNLDLPAFRMSVVEAHLCAVWLGGLLPTTAQWDKAAGLHPGDHADAPGPFKQPWNAKDPNQIAVDVQGDMQRGPLPIGKATHDISPFGVRDMAGNGFEFTREINVAQPSTETVPLDKRFRLRDAYVIFRSTPYFGSPPLTYEEMENPAMTAPYYHPESPTGIYANAETGFRVVIELGP